MISKVDQRIGKPSLDIDINKVIAVVESQYPDNTDESAQPDEVSKKIAGNILEFLHNEVKNNRLPYNLLPIQSGVGNIANAVIDGMGNGSFTDINVWTEVLQRFFSSIYR